MRSIDAANGAAVQRRGAIVAAQDCTALLGDLPLFRGIEPDSLRELLSDATIQRFARNAVLFIQDDPATRVFVILEGWVKLFRETSEGNESTIAILSSGDSLAEAPFLHNGVYPVSAIAVEESRLLVIPAARFARQLWSDVQYAQNVMASMAARMLGLMRQIEQLSAKSSAERLAGFLVRLCPPDSDSAVVAWPLDKALIAGRLGMQPETFSRALRKLARLGVESRRNEVVVADLAALRAFSEGRDIALCEPLRRRA